MPRTPVEERRKGLIAAALRVVATRGLHQASTRAIVAEANMSLASFHYAFESRDELLDHLIADVLAREEQVVLPPDLAGKSMVELLTEGLTGYVEMLQTDPSLEQAMLELTQYAVRTRLPLAQKQYEQYIRIAEKSLTIAANETNSEWTVPLPTIAKLLVALTDGLTLSWLVDRDDAAITDAVVAAVHAVASLSRPRP